MAGGLTELASQSSAVKPTLPIGVITSYVIVFGAQGLYYVSSRQHFRSIIIIFVIIISIINITIANMNIIIITITILIIISLCIIIIIPMQIKEKEGKNHISKTPSSATFI
ncbi:hypothetical protein ElyMa_003224900 [Elysia marginata]|uniref:Uncharacterized protein n=1 Tax=Elysia marginata TaxID=1093978 RepID=A0AAV4J5U3_9GAST|nr:hypothetical protein ElyMa_003224900 [Elysia marginata]